MKKQTVITIQVAVFTVLAVLGIMYILEKSPVDEVSNYKKEAMPKPYKRSSNSDYFSSKSSQSDSDAVSLTGQSGAYDEVRIGGEYDSKE